jgi:formylmethanofuran dehydrogenase subunit A
MDGDLHNYNDEDSLLCFCFPTLLPRVLYKEKKQNKTKQDKTKKNTHCCWNSYKADLRTMQQLQSTVVTICQGINGNHHEFICKVFDSFGVF